MQIYFQTLNKEFMSKFNINSKGLSLTLTDYSKNGYITKINEKIIKTFFKNFDNIALIETNYSDEMQHYQMLFAIQE